MIVIPSTYASYPWVNIGVRMASLWMLKCVNPVKQLMRDQGLGYTFNILKVKGKDTEGLNWQRNSPSVWFKLRKLRSTIRSAISVILTRPMDHEHRIRWITGAGK